MKKPNPEELIHRYVNGICTEEELILIESWHLKDINDSSYLPSKTHIDIVHKRIWKKLARETDYKNTATVAERIWKIATIAASILIIGSTAYYYLQPEKNHRTPSLKQFTQNDILPGGEKASLTLYDGKKIALDSAKEGTIAIQDKVTVSKTNNGYVVYHSNIDSKYIHLNKLETPRGGKYKIILPDGTKVWLNAASTLIFPTSFKGKDRKVILDGEAYFEVTKDKFKPFIVKNRNQIIEVLGTHFNIRSYLDESITQTTLSEGKVKVLKGTVYKFLKPGQVAYTSSILKTIEVKKADLEKNLAWKNNDFIFKGDNLITIMKEVSRWYNVEIIYQGPPDQGKYWGVISRNKNISELLKMLQSTGKINYKIEEGRITLMN